MALLKTVSVPASSFAEVEWPVPGAPAAKDSLHGTMPFPTS